MSAADVQIHLLSSALARSGTAVQLTAGNKEAAAAVKYRGRVLRAAREESSLDYGQGMQITRHACVHATARLYLHSWTSSNFVAVSLMNNLRRYLLPVEASPLTCDLHLCIILS